MDQPNQYQIAMKKVNLVERNSMPNDYNILDLYTVGIHNEEDILSLAKSNQKSELIFWQKAIELLAPLSTDERFIGSISSNEEKINLLQFEIENNLGDFLRSKVIHDAACNFQKIVGNTYHLYQRPSGQLYFSMLSPEVWNIPNNHIFCGSFQLESDYQWTCMNEIATQFKQSVQISDLVNEVTRKLIH